MTDGSDSRSRRRSSSTSTSRSRNDWKGWYHSRSQWVCGTMETVRATAGKARPADDPDWGIPTGGWSWNTRNPVIYARPYVVAHRYDEQYYRANGLSVAYDECMPNEHFEFEGCEPGDLTKTHVVAVAGGLLPVLDRVHQLRRP